MLVNSYKAWRPFYGAYVNGIAPDVTPQNAASSLGLFCLLNTGISSKNKIKIKKIISDAPINENGLSQMIRMGKSIHNISVNINCLYLHELYSLDQEQ